MSRGRRSRLALATSAIEATRSVPWSRSGQPERTRQERQAHDQQRYKGPSGSEPKAVRSPSATVVSTRPSSPDAANVEEPSIFMSQFAFPASFRCPSTIGMNITVEHSSHQWQIGARRRRHMPSEPRRPRRQLPHVRPGGRPFRLPFHAWRPSAFSGSLLRGSIVASLHPRSDFRREQR